MLSNKFKACVVTVVLVLFTSIESIAQCAMCRAALQTEETGIQAEAVNDGIVYLMAFPYVLLLVCGFVIYRIMKGKKKSKLNV